MAVRVADRTMLKKNLAWNWSAGVWVTSLQLRLTAEHKVLSFFFFFFFLMKLSGKEFPNTICRKVNQFYYNEIEKEKIFPISYKE